MKRLIDISVYSYYCLCQLGHICHCHHSQCPAASHNHNHKCTKYCLFTQLPLTVVCIVKCSALGSQYWLALHEMLKKMKGALGMGKLCLSSYSPVTLCPTNDLGNGGFVQWSGKSSCLGQSVPSPHSIIALGP